MADESTRGGANADFPRFKAGQSAADVLSASYQNKLISQIERLSQETFGPGANALVTGPCIFRKRKRAATASSSAMVHFTITSFDCDDVDEHGHHYATAAVTYVSCGLEDVSVGDSIEVYDIDGCELTGPENLIPGIKGIAFKIEHSTTYGDECVWSILKTCGSGVSC